MIMSPQQQVRLAHKMQIKWLQMVATQEVTAEAWGGVVDALFANQPEEAVLRCREGNLPPLVVCEIQKIFGLPS